MGREGRGSPHQRSGLRRWLNISYYSGPLGGTNLEPFKGTPGGGGWERKVPTSSSDLANAV